MILGIDASNVTSGGGLTHCLELLKYYNSKKHGISKIVIWSSQNTLDKLPDKKNILKKNHLLLNTNFYIRFIWNLFFQKKSIQDEKCDAMLVLGGYFFYKHIPSIVICQNMLCFDKQERSNFGLSIQRAKLSLLGYFQKRSFIQACGIIFLSKYAKDYVNKTIPFLNKSSAIIPHGIDDRFYINTNTFSNINKIDNNKPIKAIYVSKVDMYKHQWNVVEAVSLTRKKGINITLEIIGSSYKPAMRKLVKKLVTTENSRKFVNYVGEVPYKKLHNYYKDKDLIIFASSCENLPIILLEGMATSLPIISSKFGPMPEILKKNAYYFNPYNSKSIKKAIENILLNHSDRKKFSRILRREAKNYSWKKTSENTFKFINSIVENNAEI